MNKCSKFLVAVLICLTGVSVAHGRPALAKAPSIDVIAAVKDLKINRGPYRDGYLLAPNGMLNWYFTNLGLLPVVQYLSPEELNVYVLGYLNLYLQNLTPQYTIADVRFAPNSAAVVLIPSDSDDSYAATFLSLAVRYVRASQNWTWWQTNLAVLKNIAQHNLVELEKSDTGLLATFQEKRRSANSLSYLMDNAEDYRGLRDFAGLLRDQGEVVEANRYDALASKIVQGIGQRLYDASASGFITSDGDARANTAFYAGATCQVFPQAFGLNELSAYYTHAWLYLNHATPNWQTATYDPYPWAILGYVAALRGESQQAQEQLQKINELFRRNRARVTLNELGFYQRTMSILAGQPAT